MIFYPNAISNIIIITNPTTKAYVPSRSPLNSGTNSSTTTYIIAPAAKANKYGNSGSKTKANTNVIAAAIGSTIPDRVPNPKAFNLEVPLLLNGNDIAAPSGKFCTAIPKLSANADVINNSKLPYKHVARATPTATPSGWGQIRPSLPLTYLIS